MFSNRKNRAAIAKLTTIIIKMVEELTTLRRERNELASELLRGAKRQIEIATDGYQTRELLHLRSAIHDDRYRVSHLLRDVENQIVDAQQHADAPLAASLGVAYGLIKAVETASGGYDLPVN